jgi:hypothetical protein
MRSRAADRRTRSARRARSAKPSSGTNVGQWDTAHTSDECRAPILIAALRSPRNHDLPSGETHVAFVTICAAPWLSLCTTTGLPPALSQRFSARNTRTPIPHGIRGKRTMKTHHCSCARVGMDLRRALFSSALAQSATPAIVDCHRHRIERRATRVLRRRSGRAERERARRQRQRPRAAAPPVRTSPRRDVRSRRRRPRAMSRRQ